MKEGELFYLCSENKGVDQLFGYCKADLHLCFFAYSKCYDMAHIIASVDINSLNKSGVRIQELGIKQ